MADILFFTRWRVDDLIGTLIERQESEGWRGDQYEVINLPALAVPPIELDEEEREAWRDVLGRAAGDALWPERFDVETLRQLEANFIIPPRKRVLVCGSRTFYQVQMLERILDGVVPRGTVTIVHGAANGADSLAAGWAKIRGHHVEAHPADWDRHGRSAGPIRNQEMLDSGVDLVVAFYDGGKTAGTMDMVNRAVAAHVMTIEVTVP